MNWDCRLSKLILGEKKMKRLLVAAAILMIPFSGFADKAIVLKHPQAEFVPWFTGPLLAPPSITIPQGHFDIEPYVYATARTAFYNEDWKPVGRPTFLTLNFQSLFEFGLTPFMDIEFLPVILYNHTENAGNWALGDPDLLFGFQLYKETFSPKWTTAVKLVLVETFPLGKYRNLDPKKKFTDLGGLGSWQTGIDLIWGNLVHFSGHHFLSTRLSLLFTYLSPIRVKGLSTYGGGPKTTGRVHPGRNFQFDLGMEYALSQRWVLAIDIVGIFQGKNKFTGFEGPALGGGLAKVGNSHSVQYSLAPAIEYNWSDQLGLIAGVWFTVAGRESFQFTSGVVAFNYYR